MRKRSTQRLHAVAEAFGSRPIPSKIVQAGFLLFQETGELPEDYREAKAVISRVRGGFSVIDNEYGEVDWGATMRAALAAKPRARDEFMDGLLDEALNATGHVQRVARLALRKCVRKGLDLTTAACADRPLPEFGLAGFALLGWPEILAVSPYVRQAKRLFKRLRALGARIPERAPEWFDRSCAATDAFQFHGQRPEDPVMLEVALVTAETFTLMAHREGFDVRKVMAIFDAAARGHGAEREAAITELQELAAAGQLYATDSSDD